MLQGSVWWEKGGVLYLPDLRYSVFKTIFLALYTGWSELEEAHATVYVHMIFLYILSAQIQDALQRAALDSKSQVVTIFQVIKTKEMPPTYFKTNKFTASFQDIVDAYGLVLKWDIVIYAS